MSENAYLKLMRNIIEQEGLVLLETHKNKHVKFRVRNAAGTEGLLLSARTSVSATGIANFRAYARRFARNEIQPVHPRTRPTTPKEKHHGRYARKHR